MARAGGPSSNVRFPGGIKDTCLGFDVSLIASLPSATVKTEVFRVDRERYFEAVVKGPQKQGKRFLLAHLGGEAIPPRQAIAAYCYDCTGFYDDGGKDCGSKTCPLYPFMPYNPNRRKSKSGGPGNVEALKAWQARRGADEDADDGADAKEADE